MPLTDMAAQAAAKLFIGQAQTPFNQANARVGVGDSSVAFNKTHTDLQAPTNKFRVAVDAAPTNTGGTLRFSGTFSTAQANYAWNEWGVFNAGPTGGDMLNRKVEAALGTKPNTQAWQLVADVAIGA